jgi:signal transduction histidine kinase
MRLSLHHRIVLPFAVVALVAMATVTFVAYRVTSTTVAAHIRQDIVDATVVVSRNGMALNPAILAAVKQVSGAEVVTFDRRGLLNSTLGVSDTAVTARVVAAGQSVVENGAPSVVELAGIPSYYVAYRPVAGQPGTVVAMIQPTTEIDAANRLLRRTIVGAGALSLLMMVVVGQVVARRVTAPITRLATFADRVSISEAVERADEGADEVGRLGAAFNSMLGRLDQAQASIVRSEKLSLSGLFAARVAHDIRNPLSSIRMQAQLLQSQMAPGSEAREMADAILQDINQVEFVVKDLLELSRPSELRRVIQPINAVLEGIVRQITPQCRHRHIALSTSLAPDLPALSIDASRLTQALLNVVVNATEAIHEGGALAIGARLSADRADVIIEIDDDGIGIAPENISKVFDPFVTTKPGGVGLGLVNAKASIESHGGTITLTRRRPAGTRATITLPTAPVPNEAHGRHSGS